MARPKGYDEAEALDRVKAAFWREGYEGLGIRAIEEETKLGRFAIRTAFGGKEGLMHAAMGAYRAEAEEYVLGPMRARDDLDALTEMLVGIVTPAEGSCRHFGCLMVNSSIEGAVRGSELLKAQVTAHFETLREEVAALIRRAQAQGHARADLDPEDAGQFILGVVMGANVMNRSVGNVTAARGFIAQAVSTVDGWRA